MLLKLHSDGGRFGMNRCYLSLILMQEILGPFHLVGRSVGNQEKLITSVFMRTLKGSPWTGRNELLYQHNYQNEGTAHVDCKRNQ
jgi:hypothetical protein